MDLKVSLETYPPIPVFPKVCVMVLWGSENPLGGNMESAHPCPFLPLPTQRTIQCLLAVSMMLVHGAVREPWCSCAKGLSSFCCLPNTISNKPDTLKIEKLMFSVNVMMQCESFAYAPHDQLKSLHAEEYHCLYNCIVITRNMNE